MLAVLIYSLFEQNQKIFKTVVIKAEENLFQSLEVLFQSLEVLS